jgi:hypothetical protein
MQQQRQVFRQLRNIGLIAAAISAAIIPVALPVAGKWPVTGCEHGSRRCEPNGGDEEEGSSGRKNFISTFSALNHLYGTEQQAAPLPLFLQISTVRIL